MLALVARDDLRFCFRIQATQLVPQADVGLLHFRGGTAECPELLLKAGAVDRHLAGVVDQSVQQVGADAHLLLRGADADVVIVAEALAHHRRGQRFQLDPLRRGGGEGQAIVHGFGERQRCLGAAGEVFDQGHRHPDRASGGDAGDHPVQAVEPALQQRHAVPTEFRAVRDHGFQQRFHGVAELANRHDAGHPRATLQGVQVALQSDHGLAVFGGIAQLGEQAVRMVEQVTALFHEDVDQLGVESFHVQRLVRILAGRGAGEQCGQRSLFARLGRGSGLGRPALGFRAFCFRPRSGQALGLDALGFGACGGDALAFHPLRLQALGFLHSHALRLDPCRFRLLGGEAFGCERLCGDALFFQPHRLDGFRDQAIRFFLFGSKTLRFQAQSFGFFRGQPLCLESRCFGFLSRHALSLDALGFGLFGGKALEFRYFRSHTLGFDAFGFSLFGCQSLGFRNFRSHTLAFDTCGFGTLGGQSLGFRLFGGGHLRVQAIRFGGFRRKAFGFGLFEGDTCGLDACSLGFLGGQPLRFGVFGGDALCFEARQFGLLGGNALGFRLLGGDSLVFQAFGFRLRRSEAFGLCLLGGNALRFQALGVRLLRGKAFGFRCFRRIAFRGQARGLGGDALCFRSFRRKALGVLTRGFGVLRGSTFRVQIGMREWQRGFRQCIAQADQPGGEHGVHGYLRRGGVQGERRRPHRLGHFADHGNAIGAGRGARGEQALGVTLRRGGERSDRRHFGHRESAVQGVDGAQQAVGDAGLAGAGLGQPGVHGFQMATDLGAQDVQQDRVDVGGNGLHNGRRLGCLGGRGRRCKRWHAIEQHVFARTKAIGHGLHCLEVDVDRGFAAQRCMQLRQHVAGLADEPDDGRASGPRAVQHAVKHVLDMPTELTQGLGADQAAAALQGVEHPTDRAQRFAIVRIPAPGG